MHGGAWSIGDKANALVNKLSLFASLGYVFVSVNYRLSPPNNRLDPDRVMYPTHNEDVADAVAWIYANVHLYGGDQQKIALLGHSAGAHLVALTGTSQEFLPNKGLPLNTIKGVASIDTEGYDVISQAEANEAIYLNAFGTDAAVWARASPTENVSDDTSYPRFFIAKRGSTPRLAIADAFIDKLQAAGVAVSEVNGSQYDHQGINDAIGAPDETVITEPLKAFLAACFQ